MTRRVNASNGKTSVTRFMPSEAVRAALDNLRVAQPIARYLTVLDPCSYEKKGSVQLAVHRQRWISCDDARDFVLDTARKYHIVAYVYDLQLRATIYRVDMR
jgi:hypothetical protein